VTRKSVEAVDIYPDLALKMLLSQDKPFSNCGSIPWNAMGQSQAKFKLALSPSNEDR